MLALLDERLGHGVDRIEPAVQPESRVDAMGEQIAGDAAARRRHVEPPQRRAALRQFGVDRPVLQELGAIMEDAAEPAVVDELLGQRDGRHAAIVVPHHVGDVAFSTASTIFSPSGPFIASGFSHRIILPACAAAMAISA